MTAPQQEQQGQGQQPSDDNDRRNHHLAPVVPVVPGSMLAYLAQRKLQHAVDQDVIANDLVAKLLPAWHSMDFNDLDRSTPLWLSAAVPQVKTAYLQSQRTAAVFAHDVRMATLPEEAPLPMALPLVELPHNVIPLRFDGIGIPEVAPFPHQQPLVEFDDFPLKDAAMSLTITGNYNVKAQMPGPADELMQAAQTNSNGAGVRHAMNGGRNATGQVLKFDRKIIGYARITDSDPCWFCALLASRGTVYTTDSFAEGGQRSKWNGVLTKSDRHFKSPKGEVDLPPGFSNVAKVHDHCRCQLKPVYSVNDFRDDEAKFYYKQWEAVRKANYWMPNHKQLKLFRDQYTPFERTPASVSDIRDELTDRVDNLSKAGFHQFTPQMEWANRQLDQLA